MLYFDFDKTVLKPEAKAKLDDVTQLVAARLKSDPETKVILEGHARDLYDLVLLDEAQSGSRTAIDTYASDLAMSTKRAESVKAYLVGKGLPPGRIFVAGLGHERPLEEGYPTPENLAKNRVVVLTLAK